jgi:hypothetical protein
VSLGEPHYVHLDLRSSRERYETVEPRVTDEMFRGVAVLCRVMVEGISAGEVDPPRIAGALTEPISAQLGRWGDELGVPLDEAGLSASVFAWTVLHGSVALGVLGQLPPAHACRGLLRPEHAPSARRARVPWLLARRWSSTSQ